jgi:large subunit ribosomal protein L13
MNGRSIPTTHKWHLLDGTNQVVGRFASQVAGLIMGKHKPTYSPHLEHGDNVVVINASKLVFTGRKFNDKRYYWHTGWPGGLKSTSPRELTRKNQIEKILTHAVSGMLPKNGLRDVRLARLRVFSTEDFNHIAQFPQLAKLLRERKESLLVVSSSQQSPTATTASTNTNSKTSTSTKSSNSSSSASSNTNSKTSTKKPTATTTTTTATTPSS